jgi:hypothetical protein
LMAGRSHVAVLSFLRYYPHVKMSPAQHWWEYGYSSKQSSYSYLNQIQSLNLWAPRQNHSVSANARYNYSITFQFHNRQPRSENYYDVPANCVCTRFCTFTKSIIAFITSVS